MILVLSGTADGRDVISRLKAAGYQVWASAVSEYGGKLAYEAGADRVRVGPLDRDELSVLLKREGIEVLVDVTHPFAERASIEAIAACRNSGTPYLRYERPAAALPNNSLVRRVSSFAEAASEACAAGEVVFLAVGSRHLEVFVREARRTGRRVIARVLPDPGVLAFCQSLGLGPDNVVAARGPFSQELNAAMLRYYGASVLVTKESGVVGGTLEKVLAAVELGIPAIVVQRPHVDYPFRVSDFEELLMAVRRVTRPGGGANLRLVVSAVREKAFGIRRPASGTENSAVMGVVVAVHGSRFASAGTDEVEDLCRLLSCRLHGMPVKYGFLQFRSPGLKEAVDAAVSEGARRVVVVPLFLFRGAHVLRDIPKTLRELQAKHSQAEVLLASHIGPDARLAEVLLQRIWEVCGIADLEAAGRDREAEL